MSAELVRNSRTHALKTFRPCKDDSYYQVAQSLLSLTFLANGFNALFHQRRYLINILPTQDFDRFLF